MFDYINFKKFLDENGFKQKFIAQKAQITESAMSDILTGRRKCSLEEYVNICQVLKMPFGKFILEQSLS